MICAPKRRAVRWCQLLFETGPCTGREIGVFKIWRPASGYVWGRQISLCRDCVQTFWRRGYHVAKERPQ